MQDIVSFGGICRVPDVFKEDIGGKFYARYHQPWWYLSCARRLQGRYWWHILCKISSALVVSVVMQHLSSDADVTVHLVYRGLIRSGKYQ